MGPTVRHPAAPIVVASIRMFLGLTVRIITAGLTRRFGLRTLARVVCQASFVPMQRLRTIKCFVRVLAALFLVAQLAGVVASPLAW